MATLPASLILKSPFLVEAGVLTQKPTPLVEKYLRVQYPLRNPTAFRFNLHLSFLPPQRFRIAFLQLKNQEALRA
jgi:hypothetical protein